MKAHLACLLLALVASGAAMAETVAAGDSVSVRESSVERPARGMRMTAVEARFGAPREKRGPVGKPPISRWDYADFAVFFEHDRVIHAVALR